MTTTAEALRFDPEPAAAQPATLHRRPAPIVVATANTPHHTPAHGKRSILAPSLQARALARILNLNHVDSMSAQEMYTGLYTAVENERAWWDILGAHPNEIFARRNLALMNAVLYRHHRFRSFGAVNMNIPWAGRPHGLNMSVVGLERHSDRFRYVQVGAHLPIRFHPGQPDHARGATSLEWEVMAASLGDYIDRLPYPVVLGIDTNRPRSFAERAFPNLEIAAWSDVDGLLYRGFDLVSAHSVSQGFHGQISDHPNLLVANLKPKRASSTRTRLL